MEVRTKNPTRVNGIDVDALKSTAAAIQADPKKGLTRWGVRTRWTGGTRSETRVTSAEIGGQRIDRNFTIGVDEPLQLLGTDEFANSHEYLMAALNGCLTVGYVAACALEGIVLHELSIETSGKIDLRGFLGLDDSVQPGHDEIEYTVHVKADATPAQIERVHDIVCRTSPDRFNLAQPVRLRSRLVMG